MRWFYPWADNIVVPSVGAARDLARIARLAPERIQVVPSPIAGETVSRLAAEKVDHPWFVEQDPPVILGVGELCARKDFTTLIRAFAKVRRHRPSRLLILGEGRQRELLTRLVHERQLDADVSLPGYVSNPYPYMREAALLVLSSTCEGSPVVLVEALALGLAVVSTDCPSGPREILGGGRFGPLVPVGDAEALAAAIIATLDKRPDSEVLKSAASPYSVAASASQYLSVLGLSDRVSPEHFGLRLR
jgi:glycosyltransferase involved in cell wall biosynthesis